MVSIVVRGGRREKLPAREALATWILTDNDMQILTPNGELERTRVAKWVAALKKDDARPLQDEDKLDIIDMEVADKDLVIALLWQYAGIMHARDDLNRIPVSHFAASMVPTVNVFMGASNHGLCVLEPYLQQFIRVRFTMKDKEHFVSDPALNSINARELQTAVLAALHWGPAWSRASIDKPVCVRFWIDNASTVAWTQRRSSRAPLAQRSNRLLSLAEFEYYMVCSAEHIPGVDNVMADTGSRAWSPNHPLFHTWTNLSRGWAQIHVAEPFDNLSKLWAQCSPTTPLQILPRPNMDHTVSNGATEEVKVPEQITASF
ncbi:hypothetical protein PF010_g19354 [Phytophthora fragariae]|uniref:Uncharacterized protein n=1 Tax=Phytophthora fragariae TaxID=53985 RepID=A0A6A3SMK4_9STRA|nr:hypothetical protein PF010_g19354 [Phytophthora fragariae]KAE9117876.1 hypothetical protein PF006_g18721 [Phytophthora fragariae]